MAIIKERILKYLEINKITKQKFCELTGISYGNITGKAVESEFGGEQITEILRIFSDISPDWLLLGKGEMLREKCENVEREGIGFVKIPADVWGSMQMQTASLKAKDEQISRLIEMLSGNRGGGQPVEATVEG